MLKVALTGGNGLVGSRIKQLLADKIHFIDLPHNEMDITDKQSVENTVDPLDFDIVLHMAAYTLVDKAEEEKEKAYKINVVGTKNVFEATQKKGKRFILLSTDFVFDGTNPPYYEDSQPHPVGVYASTKFESEKIVGNRGMIVRIAYPYRAMFEAKKDIVRSLKFHLENKKELYMINDSLITPTFIDDIAYGLEHLFHEYEPSVYHLVGSSSLSPFDIALKIAETFDLDANLIKPVSLDVYSKGKAPRSRYSVIKSKKNNFVRMRSFIEGLEEMKRQAG